MIIATLKLDAMPCFCCIESNTTASCQNEITVLCNACALLYSFMQITHLLVFMPILFYVSPEALCIKHGQYPVMKYPFYLTVTFWLNVCTKLFVLCHRGTAAGQMGSLVNIRML